MSHRHEDNVHILVLSFFHLYSCRPTDFPFYLGIVVPFTITMLCNWIMLLTIAIVLRRKLNRSQAWIHYIQSCLLSISFAVGWTFGLILTGLSGGVIDIIGACFILTGAPLGLYIIIIYCLVSPVVRHAWKEWYYDLRGIHYKEYDPTNMPGHQKDQEVKILPSAYGRKAQPFQLTGDVIHNPSVSLGLPELPMHTYSKAPELSQSFTTINEDSTLDDLQATQGLSPDDIDPPDPSEETAL